MSKEEIAVLNEEMVLTITQQHMNSLRRIIYQILTKNMNKLKKKIEAKHISYSEEMHQNFCEILIEKNLDSISQYLYDLINRLEVMKYQTEMNIRRDSHLQKIQKIKKLALEISHTLQSQGVQRYQERIKLKLHEYKQAELSYIPRVKEAQNEGYQTRLRILQDKLKLYDQRYERFPSYAEEIDEGLIESSIQTEHFHQQFPDQ